MTNEDSKEAKGNTKWTAADEATLIETLIQEKRKANWGDNNLKPVAYTAVEAALAGSELVSGGAPKGIAAIKSHWQRLKQEFDIVKKLRELSGFGWDDERKVVTASSEVWDAYIEKHPKAKPWRKKAFPLFDDISELVEGSRATGQNIFHACQCSANSSTNFSATPAPVIDPVLLATSVDKKTSKPAEMEHVNSDHEIMVPKLKRKAGKQHVKKEMDTVLSSDEESSSDLSCKCAKSKTNYERRKTKRISAGQGLTTVADSMQNAIALLASSFKTVAGNQELNSPGRKTATIAAIEKNEQLSEGEFNDAVEMLMSSSNTATMYLAISNTASRTRFLRSQLSKHRL